MTESQFCLQASILKQNIENGSVSWASPSNIALVKYWGKKENQIPENPSISFTLNNCKTITTLEYVAITPIQDFNFEVYLDKQLQPGFKPKIETFFNRIAPYVPFLKQFKFTIKTENTFPHSSGIASSASGMSALALCIMSLEKALSTQTISTEYFKQKASFLARLGSGSACRSIDGPLVVWGNHKDILDSNNVYGVPFLNKVHPIFNNFQDTILLVDKGEKQVSSTVGHNLMHSHPFATQRFLQANKNITRLKAILQTGDMDDFIAIVEHEALTLHAMMMTSMPYFILMKPHTLTIINKIWEFRKQTKLPLCFTLDAGANVHVLYPESYATSILEFIKNELVAYCQNAHYICDKLGNGAQQLS